MKSAIKDELRVASRGLQNESSLTGIVSVERALFFNVRFG